MRGRHARRPDGPVFVDPSGRRSTAVRGLGWAVAVVVGGYLLLVAVALVGPPGLSGVSVPGVGPVLPGPGAAQLDAGGPRRQAPREVLEPAGSPTARAERSRTPAPSRSPVTAVAATPSASPSVSRPGRTPSARPTPSPTAGEQTPTPRRTGRPTEPPGRSEPPGSSRRPTRSPS